MAYLWVAFGSALGGVARYGFGLMAGRLWGDSFPWGTVAINILGSFVIGFFGALTVPEGAMPASQNMRIFVMVGICGGFTTFSSFSLQTLSLARDGNWFGAVGNVVLSVAFCLMAVTLGQVAAERVGMTHAAGAAVSHRILAVLDRMETASPVLAAAALAAERLGGASIEALHLRHDALEGFMPTEEVMTRQRQDEIDGAAARKSAEMRLVFDLWRRGAGVGAWREVTGETARVIAAAAAGADLVVIGHGAGRYQGDAGRAVHAALFVARKPTLMVSETVPRSLGQRVAVAWKPSAAAAGAMAAAQNMLIRAESVTILMATDDGGGAAPAEAQLQPLRQAGVQVSEQRFQAGGRRIGAALLEAAHAAGADLLVMGAYSRGRLAEFVLGGATREVLAAADLPVLMQH